MSYFYVVTLNTKQSNNPAAAWRFVRKLLKETGKTPAIFCLQELDRHMARTDYVDMPKLMSMKKPYVFTPAIAFSPNHEAPTRWNPALRCPSEYGIGLFFFNIKPQETAAYTLGPDESVFWANAHKENRHEFEPRVFASASFQLVGQTFVVGNTHLSPTKDRSDSGPVRRDQLKEMVAAANTLVGRDNIVIAGDFNATPRCPDLAVMAAAGFTRAQAGAATKLAGGGAGEEIDHLFYKGSAIQLVEITVRPNNFSDHAAVVGKFQIR